uniref:Protein kinase domain-containing protein n=1 Tax=Eptatretus burgeri TaxID=7764 RepID=A0A8C4R4B5_EPTBU
MAFWMVSGCVGATSSAFWFYTIEHSILECVVLCQGVDESTYQAEPKMAHSAASQEVQKAKAPSQEQVTFMESREDLLENDKERTSSEHRRGSLKRLGRLAFFHYLERVDRWRGFWEKQVARPRQGLSRSFSHREAADAGDGAKDSQVNRTRSLKQAVSFKKHAQREEDQSEKKNEISNGGMSMQCVEEISTSVKGTTAETEAMCGEADYRSEAKPSKSVLLEEEALNDMDARECKDQNVDIQVEDKEQVEDLEEGVEVEEEAVDGEEEEEQEEEKSIQEEKHKEVNEDENNKKLDNDVENEVDMKDSASGSREDTETQSSHSLSKCPDNRPQSISTENAIMGVKAKEDCISEEDSNSNSSVLKQVEKPPVIDDSPTPPAPFTHRLVTINTSNISNFYSIGKEKVLGGGRFGQVYSCVEKDTGLPFAAKIIKARAAKEKEEVKNEIGIMNQLHHDNIIQLYAAFETRISFTLIVEHVAGGELFERIVSEDYNLTELDTIIFVRQICEAIAHMHQQYILHLDLKPENILCVNREGNQIKIIDFGLARRYKPREQLKVLFGTPEFLAPEVVNYDHVSFATDMWSLGIIAYMLVSGLSPFLGDDEPETLSNIVQGNWSFDDEAFEDISDEAKGFVSELLVKDKGGRMSALQCLKHPWLCNLSEKAKKLNVKLKSQVLLHSYMMRKRWRKNFFAVTAANRLRKIASCPMKLDSETPVAKSSKS